MRHLLLFLPILFFSACSGGAREVGGFGPLEVGEPGASARNPFLFEHDGLLWMAWSQDSGQGPDIYLQAFDLEGNAQVAARRLTASGHARRPQIARAGTGLVMAWSDRVEGMMEIMAAGFDPGASATLDAVNVSNSESFASVSPRLASYEEDVLLTWADRHQIMIDTLKLARLGPDGCPLGATVDVSEIDHQPLAYSLAVRDESVLLVGNDFDDLRWEIALARLSRMEAEPEHSRPFESDSSLWAPAVARVGQGFGVVFRNNGSLLPQIVIAWLDSHAGPLGIPHELQQTIGLVHEPAVFGSGKTAVAVWRQDRPGGVDLVAVDMDFRNAPGEPVTWLEDVGRGEAPCGVLFDDRLCIAYERLTAGKGSVFLCCAARPGGPK